MSNEKKWRINDTLFYPLGIVNNSSKDKTVFVTWTYDYLMSFIFKKDEDNSTILTDVIRIPVDNIITNILVLRTNTIVLMDNGNVYYFSSPKHLKKIHSLNDIQCINASKNGFCAIRILKDYKINLQVHNDLEHSNQIGSNFEQYDITFDEKNLFNSSWKSEKFTITSICITELNVSFLKQLTKCELDVLSEIYFFSINNFLFCLCPENDKTDYNIIQLATYASEIEMIQILSKSNICLIFLNCGVIEILFESKISKMIDKVVHCVGNEFVDCTFSNDSFFYSDGNKIYKMNFDYDDLLHTCTVHTINNNVRGIVAITWVESIKKIVCLSENNIFYRCKFRQSDYNKNNQKEDNFFELTEAKVRELKEKTTFLKTLQEKPAQIQNQIEDEYLKQDIMSAYKNTNVYSKHVFAIQRLQYEPYSDYYYLVISINCTKIDMFQNINWKIVLNVRQGTNNKLVILPIHEDDFRTTFRISLPFLKEQFDMLPQLRIHLVTCVNVTNDFVCISIPINIDQAKLKDAFSENQDITQARNQIYLNKGDQSLTSFYNQMMTTKNEELIFCEKLKTPIMFGSRDLTDLFGFSPRADFNDIILKLYFIGKLFTLHFNESQHFICLKCNDPVVLFYAKTIITAEICSDSYNNFNEMDPRQLINELLKLKVQVDSIDLNSMQITSTKQSLIHLYKKLRDKLKEL